jgi:hypothetical protein
MVLYHQTFSPSTCECVIEEQFEHNEVTGDNEQPTLWFFHKICNKHLPLVENKPKLSKSKLSNKRKEIADHHLKLLEDNRKRHLKEFDEHPTRKQQLETIEQMKTTTFTAHALRIQAKLNEERDRQVKVLDDHEDNSMNFLLVGIHSPYAFIAQDVYDAIRQEQREANPVVG